MDIKETELFHYGVKGMKWGVRRYQNYDGSYTQAGLERYNKASSRYESASENLKTTKKSYKSGTASKEDVKQAKAEKKTAKIKLNNSYSQLKRDKTADKGKKLYASGNTITDYNKRLKTGLATEAVIGVGSDYVRRHSASGSLVKAAAEGAEIGSVLGSVYSIIGTTVAKRELRAYYGHSRTKEK